MSLSSRRSITRAGVRADRLRTVAQFLFDTSRLTEKFSGRRLTVPTYGWFSAKQLSVYAQMGDHQMNCWETADGKHVHPTEITDDPDRTPLWDDAVSMGPLVRLVSLRGKPVGVPDVLVRITREMREAVGLPGTIEDRRPKARSRAKGRKTHTLREYRHKLFAPRKH